MRLITERGLILSNPIEVSAGRLRIKTTALDLQEVRFALLFWDKFDFPIMNCIRIGSCDTAKFLISAGLLTRTEIAIDGGGDADMMRRTYVEAYRRLSAAEPGTWSVSNGSGSIVFADGDLEPERGILFKLHQAIPVPNQDVPLADILEFRAKRRPELLALRYHLETIYQKVLREPDAAQALNTEIDGLGSAIQNYLDASRGLNWLFRLVDFETSLNLGNAVVAGVAAYGLSNSLTAAVAAGAAVSVKPGPALKKAPLSETPFRYVSSYHAKLFRMI